MEFEVSRTLLGRLHIRALSADSRREIVVNPGNGELLRDYPTTPSDAPQLLSPGRLSDNSGPPRE